MADPITTGIAQVAQTTPERKMPDTWFRASTRATTMGFVIPREDRGQERIMPLQEGERRLGWFTLPPFQRPPVWTREQQIRFIESCWMGLPIGAIVYNQGAYDSRFDTWLLDGQQRVTSVLAYVADAFPVYGYRFSELGVVDLRKWSKGGAMRRATLRLYLQAWAKAQGFDVVPHGLRKNAVNALLEAGCSVGETSSISGQSLGMVEKYARRRNNRKMGDAAMTRWEANT